MRNLVLLLAASAVFVLACSGGSGGAADTGSEGIVIPDTTPEGVQPDAADDGKTPDAQDMPQVDPPVDTAIPDKVGPDGDVPPPECQKDEECEPKFRDLGQCEKAYCDPASGICTKGYRQDGDKCDDGNSCTETDTCKAGVCVGGDNKCVCEKDGDCDQFEDGDLCNGTLFCDKAQDPFKCEVDAATVIKCEDPGKECFKNECKPATGKCEEVKLDKGAACDDGDKCTLDDACDDGGKCAGTGKECDDENQCTADECDPDDGECKGTPLDGKSCDDGVKCTENDKCDVAGACSGIPKDCDDKNGCTIDSCDEKTGACANSPDIGSACDDGKKCTLDDTCTDLGACAGTDKECDDSNECTADSCDPATGECDFAPQPGAGCDDGDACTVNDTCTADAKCVGEQVDCDDDNPCTQDSCDSSDGDCDNEPSPGLDCDDGNPCTVLDICDADGGCGGLTINCDDNNPCTDDSCDVNDGDCDNEPVVGAKCDDGNLCTVDDKCDDTGACVAAKKDCDDQNACTADSCDAITGDCVNAPKTGDPCTDKDACTENDACDAQGKCVGTAKVCDDGLYCTGVETCDKVKGCVMGTPVDCYDKIACTEDECSEDLKKCVNTWLDNAFEGPKGNPSCTDFVDNDCDGLTNVDDPDCSLEIAGVSPDNGPEGVAITVTIAGGGFETGNKVLFDGVDATVIKVDPTKIEVIPPEHKAGKVDVKVQKTHVSVTGTGAFTYTGTASSLTWANFQFPATMEKTEGEATDKFYGRVYEPSKDPAKVVAQLCIGPAGTLPWKVPGWQCFTAAHNAQCLDCGNNLEFEHAFAKAQGGRFDLFYRFSADNGVNFLYGDTDGATKTVECTSDKAAKLTVWGVPGPGDIVVNELMWMGSNTDTNDEWFELRNMTSKPFKVGTMILTGAKTGGTDFTLGGLGHVVNTDVLEPNSLFLVLRMPKNSTSVSVDADIEAGDMVLPNPSSSSKTYILKTATGTVLDTANSINDTTYSGLNGTQNGAGNDQSQERNVVPGDGTDKLSWHTAKCQKGWGGVKDNAHNYGTPRQPNCDAQ